MGGAARMNGLHGSFDSISKSNLNSSVDEDPSFVVYEETTQSPPDYTSDVENRQVLVCTVSEFIASYTYRE